VLPMTMSQEGSLFVSTTFAMACLQEGMLVWRRMLDALIILLGSANQEASGNRENIQTGLKGAEDLDRSGPFGDAEWLHV